VRPFVADRHSVSDPTRWRLWVQPSSFSMKSRRAWEASRAGRTDVLVTAALLPAALAVVLDVSAPRNEPLPRRRARWCAASRLSVQSPLPVNMRNALLIATFQRPDAAGGSECTVSAC
jgi:hypothetical protein